MINLHNIRYNCLYRNILHLCYEAEVLGQKILLALKATGKWKIHRFSGFGLCNRIDWWIGNDCLRNNQSHGSVNFEGVLSRVFKQISSSFSSNVLSLQHHPVPNSTGRITVRYYLVVGLQIRPFLQPKCDFSYLILDHDW